MLSSYRLSPFLFHLINEHDKEYSVALRDVDAAVDQPSGMEKEFSKLEPNDSLRGWEVGASSSIVVGMGQHEVDGHITLVMMQLYTGMATALATMVVLQDVRLVAVHLDTGGDTVDQASSLLDVGDDGLGGVVDVRNLPEGNVLLRERVEIRLPSSRESRGMNLASTDDGVQ